MGYLDMKDKTLEAFGGPDGRYYHSGDLVRRDERGFLHVAGRIKGILSLHIYIPSVYFSRVKNSSVTVLRWDVRPVMKACRYECVRHELTTFVRYVRLIQQTLFNQCVAYLTKLSLAEISSTNKRNSQSYPTMLTGFKIDKMNYIAYNLLATHLRVCTPEFDEQ